MSDKPLPSLPAQPMPPTLPEPGIEMTITRIDFNHPGTRLPAVPEESDGNRLTNLSEGDQLDGPPEQLEFVDPNAFQREYLEGRKLWLTVVSLIIGTFLLMLDTSVIATAIPSITDEFHSLPDIGWYSGVYQLAAAALQPLTGKIFQKFALKHTYTVFFTVFMVGSLLCGIAKSSPMLIVGRAVAGVGGAGITTGALTITNTIAPPHRAPVLVGYVMAFSHLGIVLGPVIGGLFSEYVTWRWCFLINLPIGVAIVLPALVVVRIPEQVEKAAPLKVLRTLHKQLDLVGFSLFTPFTILLLLALQYGGSGEHPWGSPVVIGLFCGSGASFIAWAIWTRHLGREAIIPMYILKRRVVWSSILTQCLLMTAIYVVTIYLSMYFQAIHDFSPMRSGAYLLASVISQLLFTTLAAKLLVKTGFVGFFAVVAGMFTVGSNIAYAHLKVRSGPAEYFGYQVLNGVGRGVAMQSQITAISLSLVPADNAVAMAMMMFAQMLLTAIIQVVANVLFLEVLKAGLASKVSPAEAQAVIMAGATKFRSIVTSAELPQVLSTYNLSVTSVFWMVCGLGGLAVFSGLMMGSVPVPKDKPVTDEEGLTSR